jgi:methionine biosynthesis protein MetW
VSQDCAEVPVRSMDTCAAGLLDNSLDPLRYPAEACYASYESNGIIADLVPAGARVLDVGCGCGGLAALLRDRQKAAIIGVEPDTTRAETARQLGIEVHNEFLSEQLIERLGTFDVVLFADVLEHLSAPATMLELAHRALRPGGALIACVPNVAHWSVRLSLLKGDFHYSRTGIMDSTHLRWFTRTTIQSLIARNGFEIDQVRGSAGLWLPIYRKERPWSLLPPHTRRRLVLFGCRKLPGLFSCQHVVKAIKA